MLQQQPVVKNSRRQGTQSAAGRWFGATENAGVENAIRLKMQGWKRSNGNAGDWSIDSRVENAGVD